MCFMQPPETPAADPPLSDTTAADQLALGTNAVSQRNAGILGRLGLLVSKVSGGGTGTPRASSGGGDESTAKDITPTVTAPTATPQVKTGAGSNLGVLKGIVPHYLRKPPAAP